MKVLCLSIALLLGACTAEERSIQILKDSGMTDIEITGYAFGVCYKNEHIHAGFTAKNAIGKRVRGVVCCDFLSCVIRF